MKNITLPVSRGTPADESVLRMYPKIRMPPAQHNRKRAGERMPMQIVFGKPAGSNRNAAGNRDAVRIAAGTEVALELILL